MPSASPPPTRHIVLLQALRSAPERASSATAGLSAEALDWRPEAQAWNCRETISHLAAAEPLFFERLTTIMAADNPWLPRFGPETARPDAGGRLPDLLERFQAGRGRLLRYLSELEPAAWQRPAVHETLGPTTLLAQVQNVVNHDTDHLSQLERLCATRAGRPAQEEPV